MRSSFVSSLAVAIIGGLLATFSLVLAPEAVGWLTFAAGCAATAIVALSFLARGRGSVQRLFDAAIVLTGIFTIVSSRTPAASRWLCFAEGVLLCALGVVALVVREALVEREWVSASRTPVRA